MKKIISWILALSLVAALAVGGTLAYLTSTDEDVNVMTLGNVRIDQLEYERTNPETTGEDAVVREFHDNKPLYPAVTGEDFNWNTTDGVVDWEQIDKDGYTSGIWDPTKINNEIDKMVFVKNKGDYDAYVRSVIAFEANGYTVDQFKSLFHLNLNNTDWDWQWVETPVAILNEEGGTTSTNYVVAVATYKKVLEPGKLTEISLSQIALDSLAGNADIEGFGDTYQVLVKSQAIQAAGFTDPQTALDEGFGVITATENIPWETDAANLGLSLATALHYYKGNTDNKITDKISNVVFGLTEDHANIALVNDGTLVDVNQDVPVYAYYVPNSSNYDVYFLASDKIYTPKDSTNLFRDMTALKTVDTANLDVSRTTNMSSMFMGCKNLTTLDVSKWDTGNLQSLNGTFRECVSLSSLDVSNWDVSKVTTLYATFYNMKAVTKLEVGNWKTGNVTSMVGTFYNCAKLTELPITNWDVGKVTTLQLAFRGCNGLTSVDMSGWKPTSLVTTVQAFLNCANLVSVDMAGWNLPKLESTQDMLANCGKLEYANFSGWNTPSLTRFDNMFWNSPNVKELDFSSIDTRKVTSFKDILDHGSKLEKLILGPNFSVDGDGTCTGDYSFLFPKSCTVAGFDGNWYNAATGEAYALESMPADETAAVYVSVKPAQSVAE